MSSELKYLIKIVKQASKLITDSFVVNAKDNNNDLVTSFDLEIEKFLIQKIKNKFPEYEVISEEFNTNQKQTKNFFTIDPIDGSINFANGLPLWGIQIAMVKDFKTCASVLYFPKINQLYYADETGAYCNGKRLDLSSTKTTSKPLIDQIYLDNEYEFYQEFTAKIPSDLKARTIRKLYCASLSFCWNATGAIGAFVFAKDLPWDHTPGMFLVEKANGATANFTYKNKPYFISAINKQVLNKVIKAIKKTQ